MFIKKWRKHLATAMAVTMMVGASVTAYAAPEDVSIPVVKVVEEQTDATAMELAKTLVGEDVNIVSAKMEGDASSFGSFMNAEAIVGFNEGFVMSSGHLKQNDISIFEAGYGAFFSTATNGKAFKGDEIEGFDPVQNFYDYTMLEFTFIPQDENVSFQYCVASEEYPEFISSFFDQFVLLVNGVNYALVPNTNEMVTIGTVNHINNSVYYKGLDSAEGAPISEEYFVFDGITTTFSVSAKVNPGQENTIRVAIADKGDQIYDSAVFIKAGSVKEKEATPGEIVVGGVDGDILTLDRVDGTDGFVGVDVTFEDINKEEISTESVTFNDGEDVKDVTIPEGTVYFFITATAGGVEVDKVVTESQKIESYEEVTALSISGKVVAVPDVFEVKDTVSGGDATVSGGDATVSGGDATVSGGDATAPEEETSKDPEKVAYATVSLKGEGISRTTYSDENGNYVFKNLKSGYYQITVTKAGKSSSTVVKVVDSNVECNFEIFSGSSVINANNTGILVGGLNGLLGNDSPIFDATDKDVIKNGGSVNVEFNAGDASKNDVDALEAFAGKKFDKVYDLSIKKVAQNAAGDVQYTKSVSETGKLVTVVMPMPSNMKGMKDYKVYRLHEGEEPEALTEVPNANGEYIEVDQKEGVVIIHACKFSAYTSVVGEEVKEAPENNNSNNNSNNNNANNNANSNVGARDDAASGSVVSPKTGESSSTMFWCMMAVMAAAAIVFGKKATKKN